jgi:ZIP family zinc transporter
MTAAALSIAAMLATLSGGLFALRFRDRLHDLLSFTAGVLLGVVGFEVIPEIFALSQQHGVPATASMVAMVAGFLFFHSLKQAVLYRHARQADLLLHRHPQIGVMSALALIGHSLLDGVAIGLAFQVSRSVGIAVAIAIVAHDFCDGLNTVGLMLTHRNTTRRAQAMLGLDAAAPLVGAASTLLFHVPTSWLMMYLGFFAGFLLYISATDILPAAQANAQPDTMRRRVALTVLGAGLMFTAVQLAR